MPIAQRSFVCDSNVPICNQINFNSLCHPLSIQCAIICWCALLNFNEKFLRNGLRQLPYHFFSLFFSSRVCVLPSSILLVICVRVCVCVCAYLCSLCMNGNSKKSVFVSIFVCFLMLLPVLNIEYKLNTDSLRFGSGCVGWQNRTRK